MAVTVAGSRKRGLADILDPAFLDDPFPLPSHHLAKRGRRSSAAASAAELGISLEFHPVEVLRLVFPKEDPQRLQNHFEACGNVLDAAIRGYKDHLESDTENGKDIFSPQVAYESPAMNIPSNGAEWAELVVKEMSSALDLVDAKNRAFRILDLFEKGTVQRTSADATQKLSEEHKILKLMLGGLLEQNGVLKRAFLKQHSRLNDYEKMSQERSQIIVEYEKKIKALEERSQIIVEYEMKIKALEHRNYVLSYHLAQATQHGSISGNFNPDIC